MASIRQQGQVLEIRECRMTERGPRQFTLARVRDVLTAEALAEAESRAQRPFDADALIARARRQRIPVATRRTHAAARRLLAELRQGVLLDPSLVAQLRAALAPLAAAPVPEHLEEAAEWVGRSEAARGKALRGLLRTASRIARSRDATTPPETERFPRFTSGQPAG